MERGEETGRLGDHRLGPDWTREQGKFCETTSVAGPGTAVFGVAIGALLLIEIAVLSAVTDGNLVSIGWLANRRVTMALGYGATCFLGLGWFRAARVPERWAGLAHGPRSWMRRILWGLVHLAAYAWLIKLTRELGRTNGSASASAWTVGLWFLAAGLVVLSAVGILARLRTAIEWLLTSWWRLGLALALGAVLTVAGEYVQWLWMVRSVNGPILNLAARGIARHGGLASVDYAADGTPVLSGAGVTFLITPGCSEIDAWLTWLVLGLIAAWVHRSRLKGPGWIGVLLVGLVVAGLINAARLSGLVELARRWSPDRAVLLAHSRLGWLMFLAMGVGWWWLTQPIWWRGGPRARRSAKGRETPVRVQDNPTGTP